MATWESRVYCNVNSQNIAGNYSNVTIVFQIRRMDYPMVGWCNDGKAHWRIVCDGQDTGNIHFNFNWNYHAAGNWWTVATRNFDVGHAGNGVKTIGFSAHYNTGGITPPTFDAGSTVGLPTIPRYTSITSWRVAGTTQTSATFSWSTDAACDALQYSKNNAGWVGASGNTFTVGSLTPNTSYSFRIRVKRTDSQLWTESGTITAATLPIASIANTTLSCDIGGILNMSLLNYNNNASLLELKAKNSAGTWVSIGSMTSPIGTANVAWNLSGFATAMYNLCPAANALEIKVICGISNTSYNGEKTGLAKVAGSNPTFTAYNFANTDTASSQILGSTAIMGTYIGNLRVTVPAANKAVAKNGAAMKYYNVVVSSGSIVVANTMNYAASDVYIDLGNFQTPGTYTIRLDAVDSRGNASPVVSKTMVVYPYHAPNIEVVLDRLNGFDAEITMVLNTYISKLVVGSDKNAMQELKYRYKEVGGTFSAYKALSGYTSTDYQTTDKLHSLTKKSPPYIETLDLSKSYEFEFFVRDKIKTVTILRNIYQGKPIMNVLDNGKLLLNVIPSLENIGDNKANLITDKDVKAGGKYLLEEVNRVNNGVTSKYDKTGGTLTGSINIQQNDGGIAITTSNGTHRFHSNSGLAWIHKFDTAGNIAEWYQFGNGFKSSSDVYTGSGRSLDSAGQWVLLGKTKSTNFIAVNIGNIYNYKSIVLNVTADGRPLASTYSAPSELLSYCNHIDARMECVYAGEPNIYRSLAYFPNTSTTYLRSFNSTYCESRIYGIK